MNIEIKNIIIHIANKIFKYTIYSPKIIRYNTFRFINITYLNNF